MPQSGPCTSSSLTSPFQGSDINDVESIFLDDLCSILSENMQSSTSVPQAVAGTRVPGSASALQAVPGTSVPPQQLLSPERAMARYPGKDLQTLRNLEVACIGYVTVIYIYHPWNSTLKWLLLSWTQSVTR